MADKHTPGPWAIGTPGPNGCFTIGYRGLMIATVAHSINHPDQESTARANARLIAAAPELLAALESMILANKPTTRNAVALHNAYRVIAKARGEQ